MHISYASGIMGLVDRFKVFSASMSFVNFDIGFFMPFATCTLSVPFTIKLIIHLISPIAFLLAVKAGTKLAMGFSSSSSLKSGSTASRIVEKAPQPVSILVLTRIRIAVRNPFRVVFMPLFLNPWPRLFETLAKGSAREVPPDAHFPRE